MALLRGPEHLDRVRALGGEPVLMDAGRDPRALRAALAGVLDGADALVLAAGTGGGGRSSGTGADRSPARLFAAAGEQAGVRRYVMVSNWHGAEEQPWSREEKAGYLEAKAAAEDDVRARDLDWTVVRTGRLTDAPADGLVHLGVATGSTAPRGRIGRADVAAAVVALLDRRASFGRTLELTEGEQSLAGAIESLFGTVED